MKSLLSLLVTITLVKLILAQSPPRVTTPLGIVEGTVQETYTGKSFFQFEGVPYAAPPVGDLRYENPQEPSSWEGVLNATVLTTCIQYSPFYPLPDSTYDVAGVEDCLYVNVYTPTLNQSANVDVLVHIHGGALMFLSGGVWRPIVLLNKDLVFVTFNYRLGPIGFLSTESSDIPGNLGIRDQQLALKWVKQYIKYFGGNPDSITLHGLSAGGASVHLHSLLPDSKGLFHRAVAQSGSILDNWYLMENPLEQAKRLAFLVGCPTSNTTQLKSCMKTKPAEMIVKNVGEFQVFLYNQFAPWGVVVDGKWTDTPLLSDHPLVLLKRKEIHDVPFLMSYTTAEGLFPGSWFYAKEEYLEDIDSNWNTLMPEIMMYKNTVDPNITDRVSQAIRKEYLGRTLLSRCTFSGLIQALGDRLFVSSMEKALRLYSSGINSSVYCYQYNYRGNTSLSDLGSNTTENLDIPKSTEITSDKIGVAHTDDTSLMMGRMPSGLPPTTPDDINMSELLVDMTMSFITDGVPNISDDWKPISKNVRDPLEILEINRYDDLQPLRLRHIGNSPFWDRLPINENERLLNKTPGY